MPTNIYYVYLYVREKNSETAMAGTSYYVGKGKGNRAYDKHGRISVPKDKSLIVFVEKNMSEEAAFALEKSLIENRGRKDLESGFLLNMTDGGEGTSGWVPTPEWRKRNAEFRTGGKLTQKHKDNISAGNTGKKMSPEAVEKMASTHRGKPLSKQHRDKIGNSMRGKKRSPEAIERTASAHRGMRRPPRSQAVRDRHSTTMLGKKHFHNPETNKNIMCSPDNVPVGFIPGRGWKNYI